jgi:hypothetical protein
MFLYLLIRDLGDFGTIDDRLTNAAECKGQGWLSNLQWASQLSVAQEVNLKIVEDNCFKSLIKKDNTHAATSKKHWILGVGRKINRTLKRNVQQDTKSDDCKFTVILAILYGTQILVMINKLFKVYKQQEYNFIRVSKAVHVYIIKQIPRGITHRPSITTHCLQVFNITYNMFRSV